MRYGTRTKVGLRTALVAVLVACIIPGALLLHLTWWRTATHVSRNLVDTLETQITEAAQRAWWARVAEVQGLTQTLREALASPTHPNGAERLLVASARSSPTLSWLVHMDANGESTIVEGLSPEYTRLYRTDGNGRVRGAAEIGGSLSDWRERHAPLPLVRPITGQSWFDDARKWDEPGWVEAITPDGQPAVAYVDVAGGSVLAAMISHDRFARLLGDIPVGRTGRSYVLGPDGAIVLASHSEKAPRLAAMDEVGRAAGRNVAARPEERRNIAEKARLSVGGGRYAVGLSPLWFQGWQLAVIVPEAEFLGDIDATIRGVALGLMLFVLIASAAGIFVAQRLLALPIAALVHDLALVERFELEDVPRRRSRLREIDRLSQAISRMSAGLADFAKFIPTDLVRQLVSEGMRAEPGGSRRTVTVAFADLAGFTGLSERLGDGIVPVVSSYLDMASRAVAMHGGTVDKFIGDAVMAFWGAPNADPDQALHACYAALAISRAVGTVELPCGIASDLRVRIGLNSGPAVIGNVGSSTRLNYTALGDTVNLASRLEGVNKVYGTTILMTSTTREAAGDRIVAREVDTVAVYGRSDGVTIFELLDLASSAESRPEWVVAYEEALACYRAGRFAAALDFLERIAILRPGDGPSARLAEVCRSYLDEPPPEDWKPITILEMK